MIFDIEVKVSLKEGMLNPEATTIERSLALLGYDVKNAKTVEFIIIKLLLFHKTLLVGLKGFL